MQNMWGPARNTKLRDMEIQDMLILQTFQNPGRALGSQLMLTQQSRSAKRYLWMKIGLSTANVSEQISEPAALALHLVAFGIASLVAMGRLWSKRPDRDTQGTGQRSPARCWSHHKHHGGSRQVKNIFLFTYTRRYDDLSGHFPMLEDPEVWANSLTTFVRSVTAKPAKKSN